ncbi:MAG: hypothetical protein ABI682_10075 [Acidobacteriota bacterium]
MGGTGMGGHMGMGYGYVWWILGIVVVVGVLWLVFKSFGRRGGSP